MSVEQEEFGYYSEYYTGDCFSPVICKKKYI